MGYYTGIACLLRLSLALRRTANLLFENCLDSQNIVSVFGQTPACDSTWLKHLTPWSLQLLRQYGL